MSLSAQKVKLIMDLRRGGVSDRRVLGVIETLPREAFVPEAFHDRAYENTALPIAHGQTISQPQTVAFMTQALDVGPRMKVLEIGTGSGYQAAVLSKLCRRVYSIERYRNLLTEAEARLAGLGITNVTTRYGDGNKGWPEQAPFERIIVTAAAPSVLPILVDQLAEGGILVIPVGEDSGEQRLLRIRRTADGMVEENLLKTKFVPLVPGIVREG